MAKMRIYDLAKELGVDNKVIIGELEKAGVTVKSHSSSIEDDQVRLVKEALGRGSIKDRTPKVKPEVVFLSLKHGPKPARPSAGEAEEEEGEGGMPHLPPPARKVAKPAAPVEKPRPRVFIGDQEMRVVTEEAPAKPAEERAPDAPMPAGPAQAEPEQPAPAPHAEAPAEAPAESRAPGPDETAPAEAKETPPAPAGEKAPAETPPPAPHAPAAAEPATQTVAEHAPPVTAPVQAQPAPPVQQRPAPPVQQPYAPRPGQPGGQQRPGGPPRPGQPGGQQRPGGPQRPGQPQPGGQPRPGGQRPPLSPAEAAKQKERDAQRERERLKKQKGPKPPRPETAAIEGVERAPLITAKLKSRLQPVKSTKPAPAAEAGRKDVRGGKWQDARAFGRKKGKMRLPQMQQPVEEPGTVARKKAIKITEGISIKDFADKIGQKSGDIIKKLFEMGIMATINQSIDPDAAVLIADNFGLKLEVTPITDEEAFLDEQETDREETLLPRPPVVTIMGHVDHGKTSLLDAIRKTSVTSGEAGGITQHIGAYMVRLKEKDITFLDTPGHEAFTAMRARGAQVTDIVVLVVAADDGVRPQTIEAINHARAAKVPIIVAVNKIDKPEADQDKVKRELADQGLVPEDWGGDVIFAPVSAKKKIGLENLLEMILLQAEVMELKANPDKPGRGTIVEAKLDKGRGPVATVLVSTGTVRPGDVFVTGQHAGRIRMLLNDKGKKEKEAGPSMPVEVIGLSGVPSAGDSFVVMEDEKKARQVAQSRMQKLREAELAQRKRVTLDDLFAQIQQGVVKELNIIIKADVQGSVEAVADSLTKLTTEAVKLNVIHGSVGAITESDIMLASASNAIIIGFNIRPEPKASQLAESEGVDVRLYNIIYNAIEEVRAAMEGLLEPTLKEKVLGRAEVRQTFSVPKIGMVAGSYVIDGTITRGCAGVRVLRDNVVIYEGKLGSLRRFKEDVKEVATGYECGIGVENFNDIKVGDIIEAYDVEKLVTKL